MKFRFGLDIGVSFAKGRRADVQDARLEPLPLLMEHELRVIVDVLKEQDLSPAHDETAKLAAIRLQGLIDKLPASIVVQAGVA